MSLSDDFRERMDESPDKWTLAWWRSQFQEVLKGYRGATHAVNRALAECEDEHLAILEVQKRLATLEKERDAATAKLGELSSRVDKMAQFLTALKAKGLQSDD